MHFVAVFIELQNFSQNLSNLLIAHIWKCFICIISVIATPQYVLGVATISSQNIYLTNSKNHNIDDHCLISKLIQYYKIIIISFYSNLAIFCCATLFIPFRGIHSICIRSSIVIQGLVFV